MSALAGSVLGGLTSGMTTLMAYHIQARAGHRLHRIAQRADLYRDFIAAASATYGNALLKSQPEIQDLVVLHGMISRMRVLSSEIVVATAEETMNGIVETFNGPNKPMAEIRNLVRSSQSIDPLKHFSETARDELNTFG